MQTTFNRRLFAVWLVLVGITLTYLWIDHAVGGGALPKASSWATVATICLALIKVRIIMREFMEVRHAPRPLCRLTDLLVVVMAAALLGAYAGGKLVA